MNNSGQSRDEIWQQRNEIFRPQWFACLFGAKLGLGDTFWIGHFGLQLMMVPFGLVLYVIAYVVNQDRAEAVFYPFSILQLILSIAVFQAVVRVAWRMRQAGKWPWLAILFSGLNVVTAAYYMSVFSTI